MRGHSLLLAALATASLSLATEALVGRAQRLEANGGVAALLLSPESLGARPGAPGGGPASSANRHVQRCGSPHSPRLDTEIVGLVADTRYGDVKTPAPPILYVPYRQGDEVGSLTFYARSSLPPESMLRTIPALVANLDPALPVTHVATLRRQVEEASFEDRIIAVLSAAFAALATLLAAVGLYGVLAYTVAQRTREFGLRMALGADAASVRAMVLGQVGRMTLVAGAVGLAAAFGTGRLAQSLLYEIEGPTPAVVAAAVLALAAVALGAGFVPAQRAARVDPMAALRHE